MKSKVYLARLTDGQQITDVALKLGLLVKNSRMFESIVADSSVAVKLHFGEEANTGYVKPQYLRVIAECLKEKHAQPFLSDTNTLYRGKRMNSSDHTALAYEHGFTKDRVLADVIIPDDTLKDNIQDVPIHGKYVANAKIAKVYWDADYLVGVAHFKGHIMTGFGGALKNLGMGCATREGKLQQHSHLAPFVIARKCTGCAACQEVCPPQAITMKDKVSYIDAAKCIGCASCIAACKFNAIELSWEAGGKLIQERMVEYAQAVLANKKDKSMFFNFCLKITAECDCIAKDDPKLTPDIGILASTDPVAIDKASFDLVVKQAKKDVFKQAHPKRDGLKQLLYAQERGLGSLEYELMEV